MRDARPVHPSVDAENETDPHAQPAFPRAAITALALATLALAGCSSPSDEAPPPVPTTTLTPALAHLHGLHIDAGGTAWRSRDGRNWEQRSFIGPVEAIAAAGFDTAYAATSQFLYRLD